MRTALLSVASVLVAVRSVLAVAALDLAVTGIRVPGHVKLTDARPTARRHAAVRIENRGSQSVVVGDDVVQLTATAVEGPIACAPVGIASARRSPVTLSPGRARTLRYRLDVSCGPNPDGGADWTFAARTILSGDEDSTDDVCPRASSGTEPGCPASTIDVRDARATRRFELPGRYGVGETSLVLVDPSRPTMAHGTFPGAPARTLPTAVWYPSAADASGVDAALASDGRPFPLVIFAHALGSYNRQSTFLTTHLASHGYIVAAPSFPLSNIAAPGGATVVDVPAQVGDVTFLIDSFLGFAADPANRFARGVDGERIGLTGHSGGALTALVATYDAKLREPRIKAVVPLAPPSCFLQPGYFDAARVPLLVLQGDRDLLVDPTGDAGAVYARAQAPKALVLVHGGTHFGFADLGATLGDGVICSTFPDRTDLDVQIAALLAALGGPADHVGTEGCPTAYCAGDGTHPGGARQQQITKETALAFFEELLRGDRKARRYVATLAARNPDVTLRIAR